MEHDFPAAHSMDTHWFAVDKCGHVATFDSGEEGAVPEGAPDAYHSLADDLPLPGELDRCLQERMIVPGDHGTKIETVDPKGADETSFARGFFLLGPGLKLSAQLRQANLDKTYHHWIPEPVFGTTDGRDWVRAGLSVESYAWLHAMPHRCLGCVPGLHLDFEKRAEACRIIRYDCSEYGVVPYERVSNPPVPTTIEELQKLMARPLPPAPRFEQFCFRDKRLLQPMQWMRSNTYRGDGWTDEEGQRREFTLGT